MIKDNAFRQRLIEEAKRMQIADNIGQTLSSSRYALPGKKDFLDWHGGKGLYTLSPTSLIDLASSAVSTPLRRGFACKLNRMV